MQLDHRDLPKLHTEVQQLQTLHGMPGCQAVLRNTSKDNPNTSPCSLSTWITRTVSVRQALGFQLPGATLLPMTALHWEERRPINIWLIWKFRPHYFMRGAQRNAYLADTVRYHAQVQQAASDHCSQRGQKPDTGLAAVRDTERQGWTVLNGALQLTEPCGV